MPGEKSRRRPARVMIPEFFRSAFRRSHEILSKESTANYTKYAKGKQNRTLSFSILRSRVWHISRFLGCFLLSVLESVPGAQRKMSGCFVRWMKPSAMWMPEKVCRRLTLVSGWAHGLQNNLLTPGDRDLEKAVRFIAQENPVAAVRIGTPSKLKNRASREARFSKIPMIKPSAIRPPGTERSRGW